ncbi:MULTISPECIES: hypothetical protein [Photorhabdus]|uniref:hypothetical protein n=1 Tax=Photorhabdus TaxID=29487 RepID=UPI0004B149FA|nr:hypothetical protein [Photorhabdus khanii]
MDKFNSDGFQADFPVSKQNLHSINCDKGIKALIHQHRPIALLEGMVCYTDAVKLQLSCWLRLIGY